MRVVAENYEQTHTHGTTTVTLAAGIDISCWNARRGLIIIKKISIIIYYGIIMDSYIYVYIIIYI